MNALTGFLPMNSDILKQLVAERDQARQKLAAAEQQLTAADAYLRQVEEAIRAFRATPPVQAVAYAIGRMPSQAGKRPSGALTPQQICEYARGFLLETGRPLKRGALLRVFDEKGVTVVGGDRAKVLGTILWRARNENGGPSFVNTESGYWPSDIPVPRGGD